MTTSSVRKVALAATLLTLIACDSATSPRTEVRVVGTLSDEVEFGSPIEAPDSTATGVPFVVTVRTMGDGCVRAGPTEVSTGDNAAFVTPYDYTVRPPGSTVDCDLVLKIFEHQAAIVFRMPGSATITVQALDAEGVMQDYPYEVWVQ